MTQKAKHKYRVTVYLGKDNYNKIKKMADFIQVSPSTIVKMMFDYGMTITDALEKGANANGSK